MDARRYESTFTDTTRIYPPANENPSTEQIRPPIFTFIRPPCASLFIKTEFFVPLIILLYILYLFCLFHLLSVCFPYFSLTFSIYNFCLYHILFIFKTNDTSRTENVKIDGHIAERVDGRTWDKRQETGDGRQETENIYIGMAGTARVRARACICVCQRYTVYSLFFKIFPCNIYGKSFYHIHVKKIFQWIIN